MKFQFDVYHQSQEVDNVRNGEQNEIEPAKKLQNKKMGDL
jgi:hypothetical protein